MPAALSDICRLHAPLLSLLQERWLQHPVCKFHKCWGLTNHTDPSVLLQGINQPYFEMVWAGFCM